MDRAKIILLLLCLVLLVCLIAAVLPQPSGEDTSVMASVPATTPQEGVPSPTQEELPPPTQETEAAVPETTQAPDYIRTLLREMTLREKVGQLFVIRPESLNLTGEAGNAKTGGYTQLTDAMKDALKEYPVGGIVMFSKNIESPAQITAFNASLQAAVEIPLFICVDEEGGSIARLANHSAFRLPKYKSAAAVGKTGDPKNALEMGRSIGTYLASYGFNTDFAPIADVNTNPKNTVIGDRAFSSDPEIAAQMASAMAQGLRESGIIPVFKHFPGHGDTKEDSHDGLAVSNKTMEELSACEWLPFEAAGSGDWVMTGHISLPNVTGSNIPATMSEQVVTGILKTQLGFQGLVITDSLEMDAITDLYDSDRAPLEALRAGCDLLLMPIDFTRSFDAVVEAVETGGLSEARLDAIVERILRFKAQYGLLGVG